MFSWPINVVGELLGDKTISAAGTGVISDPNTGAGYYIGMWLSGGSEALAGGIITKNTVEK